MQREIRRKTPSHSRKLRCLAKILQSPHHRVNAEKNILSCIIGWVDRISPRPNLGRQTKLCLFVFNRNRCWQSVERCPDEFPNLENIKHSICYAWVEFGCLSGHKTHKIKQNDISFVFVCERAISLSSAQKCSLVEVAPNAIGIEMRRAQIFASDNNISKWRGQYSSLIQCLCSQYNRIFFVSSLRETPREIVRAHWNPLEYFDLLSIVCVSEAPRPYDWALILS